ncbi:MAG: hypothetical protein AB1814_19115 [Thermodesulfobacteriota bacterium]
MKKVFCLGTLLVTLLLLAGHSFSSDAKAPQKPQSITGELATIGFFGYTKHGFDFSVTRVIQGFQFTLKEHPGKVFRYYSKTPDEMVNMKVMYKDTNGQWAIKDSKGKKVGATYVPDPKGHLKVLSFKWLK